MPIVTITADTYFIQRGNLESRRVITQVRGRGRVVQQGDELCRVTLDLVEFARDGASPPPPDFQGTLELAGGVPLDVGLRNLVLDLPDGRRVAIDVTSLTRNERREVYGVRGTLVHAQDA